MLKNKALVSYNRALMLYQKQIIRQLVTIMGTNIQPKTKKTKYVHFPLWILQGADVNNISETAYKIITYIVYKHATEKLKLGILSIRIDATLKYYGIYLDKNSIINYNEFIETGETLNNSGNAKYPLSSISANKLADYFNHEMNEFDAACFLAYCGLTSIVQNYKFKQTTKVQIISRMTGTSRNVNEDEIPQSVRIYLNRYHFDKLKWELKQNWGVKFYGLFVRGIYVSFVLTLNNLIENVEKYRKEYLIKHDRDEQLAARKRAIEKINNPGT